MSYLMTKKELATIAGYSYRQLYNIDRDLPENRKLFVTEGEGKKCDLAMFVQRWVEYNVSHETAHIEDLDQIKAKHEVIKAEKTQIEVDKMKGKLVDIQDVKRLWGNIANTVMQNMIRLPHKIAPMLRMMENTEEIAFILDDEIRTVLNNIADTPLPDEADETSEEDEEEA